MRKNGKAPRTVGGLAVGFYCLLLVEGRIQIVDVLFIQLILGQAQPLNYPDRLEWNRTSR